MKRFTPGLYSPAQFHQTFKVGDVLIRKGMGTTNVRTVKIEQIMGNQVYCSFPDKLTSATCNIGSYTWRRPGDWP